MLPSKPPKQLTFSIVAFSNTGSTLSSNDCLTSTVHGVAVSKSVTTNTYSPGCVRFVNTPLFCETVVVKSGYVTV